MAKNPLFKRERVSVTKDTLLGDLMQMDINTVMYLMDIGMGCLYCPASQMETIEEAAMIHGIDPDALVEEINDFLAQDLVANDPI